MIGRLYPQSGAFSRLTRSLPKGSEPDLIVAPAALEVIRATPAERDRVRAALVAAGLSLPAPAAPVAGQLSPEQREELAQRVGVGRPLSELIIEERQGH
jgi:hypothetical protein